MCNYIHPTRRCGLLRVDSVQKHQWLEPLDCPRSVKAIFIVHLLLLRHTIETGIYINIMSERGTNQ